MKIGIFTTYFPYRGRFDVNRDGEKVSEGVGEVCYNLALELEKRGHTIKIFATSNFGENEKIRSRNIEVYRYKKAFKFQNTDISLALFKEPLKHEIDVIHLQGTPFPGPIAGYIYAKKKRKPFVLSYHGDLVMEGSILKRIATFALSKYSYKILNEAKIITAVSTEYVNQSKILKRYINKIKIIPNGINLSEYSIHFSKIEARRKLNLPDDAKIILFVGGLVEHKNPHILLRAMPIIQKSIPNAKLIIAGEGLMRDKLKRLSQKLDVNNDVRFTGSVMGNEKLLYYKSADVFVLPSFSECFGLVLLEASAFGLPLVVSSLEAFKAVVEDRYNGLFTKTGDEKDLAEKIVYLLENEDVREKMGKNARKKVENYSCEGIAEEFEKVYNEVIS